LAAKLRTHNVRNIYVAEHKGFPYLRDQHSVSVRKEFPEKVEVNASHHHSPKLDERAVKSIKNPGHRYHKGALVKVITNRSALISAILFMLTWTTACQTTPESKSGNANSSTTNTVAQTTTNTNQTEVAKTVDSTPSGGSLATPTEAYKTGYAARKNKDIAGLKRVLSKEALQFLTDVGKAEQKTLDDQLMALAERPQAPTAETRDEKINGDRATLEYLNERGKWVSMDFVKEGSDWKIGLPKAQ